MWDDIHLCSILYTLRVVSVWLVCLSVANYNCESSVFSTLSNISYSSGKVQYKWKLLKVWFSLCVVYSAENSSFISLLPVSIPLTVPSRCLHKSPGCFTILHSGSHHICPACLNSLFITFTQEVGEISSWVACDAVYLMHAIGMDTWVNLFFLSVACWDVKKHFLFP